MSATSFPHKGRTVEIKEEAFGAGFYAVLDNNRVLQGFSKSPRTTIRKAKRLIDDETWRFYCDCNIAHGVPEADTEDLYQEWCAEQEAEGWKHFIIARAIISVQERK